MITYVQGDLFTSPAHVLVNTVNTVGVMGKGIAKEFKSIYPEMFDVYQALCERGELTVGRLMLYRTPHKWVLNFPTKRHWRQRSRLEDIDAGLKTFVARYAEMAVTSIAFPQLGCGNGELDWESEVRPTMERLLAVLPIDIYVHIYDSGSLLPEHHNRDWMRAWLRSEPKSLAFSEFWEDVVRQIADINLSRQTINGWSVSVTGDGGGDAVVFHQHGDQLNLAKEDLLDLWQRFRSFGLLARTDLPVSYQRIADPLFSLLIRLTYIEETCYTTFPASKRAEPVSTTRLLAREEARGIRLVPPVELAGDAVQSSLFPETDVA